MNPFETRSSGILLHPTSLPAPFPNGDIGPGARGFIDFCKASGQRWWQMLPIHPIGGYCSPYDSPSAFAGNELLISLEDLVPLGLIDAEDIRTAPRNFDPTKANFDLARRVRTPLLEKAFSRARAGQNPHLPGASSELRQNYDEFLALNHTWVWDFALFMALREQEYEHRSWVTWAPELRSRDPEALGRAHEKHRDRVHYHVYAQFLFHFQWGMLRKYAHKNQVRLLGDVPMFVSHDSVDVWANQRLFFLDDNGHRTVQAGVPPDYFSEDGQLWGNPLYRWDVLRETDYGWWLDRLRRELHKFDAVRLDHFIALSRYWEIPISAASAREGRYVETPGYDFLHRVRQDLAELPFIAEDLGIVTDEVTALRKHFGLPGMKVLQFGFAPGAEVYLPHRYEENCVAYLGTHDNGTTRGWFEGLLLKANKQAPISAAAREELRRLQGYTGIMRTSDACRQLIRTLLSSPARTVFVTAQDLLDLGDEARMNVPGVADGNWTYRLTAGQLTPELAEELLQITQATER